MQRRKWATSLIAGFGVFVLASPPAYATDVPSPAPSPASSMDADLAARFAAEAEALRAAEIAGADDPITGPHSTKIAEDGSVETFAEGFEVKALAASDDACGNTCDGEDPATFLVKPPGGPSNWYYCGTDAETIYTKRSADGDFYAQLRYSKRCRTAWTRGCCYTTYAGFSYNGTKERSRVYAGCASCGSQVYTAMLNDAGYKFKACWNRVIAGSGADWQCTKTY